MTAAMVVAFKNHAAGTPAVDGAGNGHADVRFRRRGIVAIRYRRRKGFVGLGIALLALGGGGAYVLAERASDAVDVLAVAVDVPQGHVIDEADLRIASAVPDSALSPVPASRLEEIVGQRAAADLTPGTLLTEAAITGAMVPATGETVVGVAVTAAQLPAEGVEPGSQVRIFDTPNPGDDPPENTPMAIAATVLSISSETSTGHIIVNVVVDRSAAGDLVARVATGRIGIVVDSLEDGQTS